MIGRRAMLRRVCVSEPVQGSKGTLGVWRADAPHRPAVIGAMVRSVRRSNAHDGQEVSRECAVRVK